MGRKKGKYQKNSPRRPLLIWLLAAALILTATTGSVLAYLSIATGETKNTFETAPTPAPEILDTFDGRIKQNVTVDVGAPGYPVYVRALIVVTWQDANGKVWRTAPNPDTEYELIPGTNPDFPADIWTRAADGFWYYPLPVPSGASTPVLIKSCALRADVTPPPGYNLNVEIVTQTVQAPGVTDTGGTPAVTDAWGIAVDSNGRLIIPAP